MTLQTTHTMLVGLIVVIVCDKNILYWKNEIPCEVVPNIHINFEVDHIIAQSN